MEQERENVLQMEVGQHPYLHVIVSDHKLQLVTYLCQCLHMSLHSCKTPSTCIYNTYYNRASVWKGDIVLRLTNIHVAKIYGNDSTNCMADYFDKYNFEPAFQIKILLNLISYTVNDSKITLNVSN